MTFNSFISVRDILSAVFPSTSSHHSISSLPTSLSLSTLPMPVISTVTIYVKNINIPCANNINGSCASILMCSVAIQLHLMVSSSITIGDVLFAMCPNEIPKGNSQPNQAQVETACWKHIQLLPADQQCAIFSQLFGMFLKQNTDIKWPPSDFLELVVRAMLHLQHTGHLIAVYLVVKALGTMRADQSDSLLPVKRMPMGLVRCIVQLFTASSTQQVHNHCGNTVPHLPCYTCGYYLC